MLKNNNFKLVLLVLSILYVLLCIDSALRGGDFDVYLDAAIKLNDGQNIYLPTFYKNLLTDDIPLQYFYSPLFALILIPFTANFFVTELVWLLLTGFLLYRTWILIIRYFDISVFGSKDFYIWAGITFFFIFRFILYNVAMVQVTIFLLWAFFESINLIKKDKPILGALLLAFSINIKLMPLVALPYLIYRGYYKGFIYVIIFILIFLFLPSIFIGHDFNVFLLKEWWVVINPANVEHMMEPEINSQSLVGVIPVFITESVGELEFKRNILNLSVETAELITNIVRLLLILLTVYFLKSPFKKYISRLTEIRALSYIALIVPLIFPHQQKYAFIFILPMIIYLSYYCIVMWKYNRNKNFLIYFSFLLLISIIYSPIIGTDIIGRNLYYFLHHFRILGIGTLLLILFAILANPATIERCILVHKKEDSNGSLKKFT